MRAQGVSVKVIRQCDWPAGVPIRNKWEKNCEAEILDLLCSIQYLVLSHITSMSSSKSTAFYFGGVASCAAAMVSHPFDLAKVRLQTTTGSSRSGMLKTMFTIVTKEGPTALYAGLSASLLRQATYSTVRFGVYDKLKTAISTGNQSKCWDGNSNGTGTKIFRLPIE